MRLLSGAFKLFDGFVDPTAVVSFSSGAECVALKRSRRLNVYFFLSDQKTISNHREKQAKTPNTKNNRSNSYKRTGDLFCLGLFSAGALAELEERFINQRAVAFFLRSRLAQISHVFKHR